MGERESQFAAAFEEKKHAMEKLAERQRRIAELQALAARGTPEQKTQALRKLYKLLRGEEEK